MRILNMAVLVAPFLLFAAFCCNATTILIKPDGTGDVADIQTGLDVANEGDTLLLADGVFQGKGNRNLDCHGSAVTVMSAASNPLACVIDCQQAGRGLIFDSGELRSCMVQEITIRNASAPLFENGGAIFCDGASPTLQNCIIELSNGGPEGGGAYCTGGATPRFDGCVFRDNYADLGGGVCCRHSNVEFRECVFDENAAMWEGGGIYSDNSTVLLSDVLFSANHGDVPDIDFYGAAIATVQSTLEATSCEFIDNVALGCGAVAINAETLASFDDCVFHANVGGGYFASYFGTLVCDGGSVATLTSCVIAGNLGGVYCQSAGTHVMCESCAIVGNYAAKGGGVRLRAASAFECTHTIIWDNCASESGDELFVASNSVAALECSCIDTTGIGPLQDIGEVMFSESMVYDDPFLCEPPNCFGVPSAQDSYGIYDNSPCMHPVCGTIGARGIECWTPQSIEEQSPINDDALKRPSEVSLCIKPAVLRASVQLTLEATSEHLACQAIPAEIHTVEGRLVRRLSLVSRGGELFETVWDGCDSQGSQVPEGCYLVRAVTPEGRVTRRVIALR